MQYFGSHLGIEHKATWGPKFIPFIFGTQGVFVPNFKSVAQITSEISTMPYFGGHPGMKTAPPDAQNLIRLSPPMCASMCEVFMIAG